MRILDKPVTTHMDHVGAVMSVSYSSTGREFVSGGYDRTVRLWDRSSIHSRDVYALSESLWKLMRREQQKLDYYDKLNQRYKHQPEIKRIAKYRVCVEFLVV